MAGGRDSANLRLTINYFLWEAAAEHTLFNLCTIFHHFAVNALQTVRVNREVKKRPQLGAEQVSLKQKLVVGDAMLWSTMCNIAKIICLPNLT